MPGMIPTGIEMGGLRQMGISGSHSDWVVLWLSFVVVESFFRRCFLLGFFDVIRAFFLEVLFVQLELAGQAAISCGWRILRRLVS